MTDEKQKSALCFPTLLPGHVWLVGAGPGNIGLITLLCKHALEQADAIVYDALVHPEVLTLARKQALLLYAGKRGGRPSPKQADISKTVIRLAKEKRRVLRLKGGDPLLFGRGVEEALALVAQKIPFRIVPGITSGSGGLTWAGIPLTHRDTNSAVTFLTGHCASDKRKINWEALAQSAQTLVIYMPLKNLSHISARLISGGRKKREPVALVSRASTRQQAVVETNLAQCAQTSWIHGIHPPCLMVVGRNVTLRAGLDWLGAMEQKRSLNAFPLAEEYDPSCTNHP